MLDSDRFDARIELERRFDDRLNRAHANLRLERGVDAFAHAQDMICGACTGLVAGVRHLGRQFADVQVEFVLAWNLFADIAEPRADGVEIVEFGRSKRNHVHARFNIGSSHVDDLVLG